MKKLLAVFAAAIMVVSMVVPAFAQTYDFDYKSQTYTVEIEGEGITISDSDILLAIEEADRLIEDNQTQGELTIVMNGKDLQAANLPVDIKCTVKGTKAPQKVYFFHYYDGAWHVEFGGEAPTTVGQMDQTSPIAVVVYTPGGGQGGKSPATGETNAIPFVLTAVIAAGALAFVFAPRKRNA